MCIITLTLFLADVAYIKLDGFYGFLGNVYIFPSYDKLVYYMYSYLEVGYAPELEYGFIYLPNV